MSIVTPGPGLSVERRLSLLGIPRSNYYWTLHRPTEPLCDPEEMHLREEIQSICLEQSHYGYRRVTQELHDRGFRINHKRVIRLMEADNLLCLRRKAFVIPTTDSNHTHRIYPNLARGLVLDGINQLWVADITYIRLRQEFVYLAVILDAYSRLVVGWAMSRHINAPLTLAALKMAIETRCLANMAHQLIHHSDRGVQYACGAYVDSLRTHNVRISMSRKGNPYDNAKAESFMKTLKQEEVYMNEYNSLEHARENIEAFLHNYNHRRLHSAIGYVAPATFETTHKHEQRSSTLMTAFSVQ